MMRKPFSTLALDRLPAAPLVLREQGNFFVGGETVRRELNTSMAGDSRFPPGDIVVNQMYVEYQAPEDLTCRYPLVMLHGGGHTGAVWRTTPDGREGWFTSFARRGFAVYIVDAPNRGRSGWDPTARFAACAGHGPTSAMEPGNIYSAQAAWAAFRWGAEYGQAYGDTQFPLDHLAEYMPQVVPSYRGGVQNDLIARNIALLAERIGPCILLGWSTGGGNVMMAAAQAGDQVKAVVALEPVLPRQLGYELDPGALAAAPLLAVLGDNMPAEETRAFTDSVAARGGRAETVALPEIGIRGNGHTMMLECNSEQIADLVEDWIRDAVPDHASR
jgi:pimeloyl-ACP methyl ester carboxylesterase